MQFPCPTCNATLALPDESGGRKAQCPSCQAVFTVPAVNAASNENVRNISPAIIYPDRKDAVACPGCDKLLAFNSATAGHVMICPSCQRRVQMPTAAQMDRSRPPIVDRTLTDPGSQYADPQALSGNASPEVLRGPFVPQRSNDPYAFGSLSLDAGSSGKYDVPGWFLIGVSSFHLMFDLLWFGLVLLGLLAEPIDQEAVVGFVFSFFWFGPSALAHSLSLFAGWKMTRRTSLTLARTGAILAIIPCGFCNILSLPVGIWATVVLFGERAKIDFQES